MARAFCVSDLVPGITLQEAPESEISRLMEPLTDAWSAMSLVDLASTPGFGPVQDDGAGSSASWHRALLAPLDDAGSRDLLMQSVDADLVDGLGRTVHRLAARCPELQNVVHGDFGSNNILVQGDHVTGVVDWSETMYGDPLYDVATARFWRPWLACMRIADDYWSSELGHLPDFESRCLCYALRIGWTVLVENARERNRGLLDWLQDRCKTLLSEAQSI